MSKDKQALSSFKLVYTPLFVNTLAKLQYFLSANYSEELALNTLNEIEQKIREVLHPNPFLGAVIPELQEIGICSYRKFIIDKHNVLFYKLEDKSLIILAIMDMRQNINDVLYDALIAY
uniref:type II toxin-antitoxin system RelE/ParE family toxin n=1 Tax=Ningiella ruwaisensis TaxID=2364274 RepID=UPI00109FD26A|nr:type II toxin-antitoxin system RelE/ParE family toxin [Ningiella ruwaisensis]